MLKKKPDLLHRAPLPLFPGSSVKPQRSSLFDFAFRARLFLLCVCVFSINFFSRLTLAPFFSSFHFTLYLPNLASLRTWCGNTSPIRHHSPRKAADGLVVRHEMMRWCEIGATVLIFAFSFFHCFFGCLLFPPASPNISPQTGSPFNFVRSAPYSTLLFPFLLLSDTSGFFLLFVGGGSCRYSVIITILISGLFYFILARCNKQFPPLCYS